MGKRLDHFFVWVWRVVGLGILGLGLLFVLTIAGAFRHERPQQRLTQVAGTDLNAQKLRLSNFMAIPGTKALYANLAPEQAKTISYSSGNDARNVLFFNTEEKKAHWLLPSNNQTISYFSFLAYPTKGPMILRPDNDQKVVGILFSTKSLNSIVPENTVPQKLCVADANGSNIKTLVENSEEVLGFHQPSQSSVLIFYASKGEARVLDYDLTAREVKSDTPLSAK